MFDKYINYNRIAEDMIRSRDDNLAALESLTEQYAELLEDDGVGAIRYDKEPVQTSPTDDALINVAIQRETVKKRMDELNIERKLYDKAWNRLIAEEKQVLEVFLKSGMVKQDAVDLICNMYRCERTTAYRKRDAAIKRFKKLLFG